ncbi:MAG: pyridoxine 5'-phosphate synthase [Gammaproteobacteria bacterium]|nr:pyridoxine 5'-phosphate synthase [Gammaproteobacteria bacterium]MBT3488950.1 pyridoxine 5'-phosphate synthase [Gammaproteobacteria bacterium]MBT3719395.1 pyridoxine 5'-phosphate synthase [Gammaproteobacteria bacterium]MBT3844558.1 pyridoxine 5'-phosphate synthase [Gammaproteobacteria bacterium]MBT3893773.1 pyridoxine 5'-phosphate synthase [Gammaproteobacteria bacterium]
MSIECTPLLGVNIDHVATLRQARGTRYPDPVQAAIEVEQAGADGITMHLREDRRHIQERDLMLVKEVMLTRINMEMAVTDEMITIAERLQPADCCLVPEKREELTTEGGLDVAGQLEKMRDAVARLSAAKIQVSPFIDPDSRQIDAVAAVGAPVCEIHTGRFADAVDRETQQLEFERIREAARYAHSLGIQVNAGHGLNYQNVQRIAALPEIVELNIGHAIIAQSIFSGLQNAVREMKRLMVGVQPRTPDDERR